HVASMITRVDTPDLGSGPVGPSRSQIVVLGGSAGLILGLGILFLTTPVTFAAPPTMENAASIGAEGVSPWNSSDGGDSEATPCAIASVIEAPRKSDHEIPPIPMPSAHE